LDSASAWVAVAEKLPLLVDILADYFARIAEEPRADYFARIAGEPRAGYFDKVVGFLVVDSLGTIAGEHMARSGTIAEEQLMVDYLVKAGMYWGMVHWMCRV